MVSSWKNLPKELLRAIFTDAKDYTDNLQLQLTCKSWNKVAKEVFYQDIGNLRSMDTRTRIEQLIESFLQPNNEAGSMVREFHAEFCPDKVLIARFLSLCPNLTHIDAMWIESQREQEDFFDILYDVRSSGRLQKLQKVRSPLCSTDTSQLEEKYYRAMFACKDTLTHLQMVDGSTSSRPYNTPPQHFIEAFDRLVEFPQLKSMKITIQSITYLCEMDSFIQKLDRKVDTLTICLGNTRDLQPVEPINYTNIVPRTHMKHLKVKIASLKAEDLEFIMNKFPELVSLEIVNYGPGIPLDLDTTNSLDIMARLIRYVSTLRSYKLNWIAIAAAKLRPTLADIQKSFQITELTISDNVPIVPSTQICLAPRKEPGIEHAACMFLMTRQQQQHRKPFYEYTLGLMRDSIRELKIICDIQGGHGRRQEYAAARKDQGDAILFALNTLPNLKSLEAADATITTMPSTITPVSPKLMLDVLTLGPDVHYDAYFEMSRRIRHIKLFTMGGYHLAAKNYVINMPYTTFEKMCIGGGKKNCIVKLYTPEGITYHGFGGPSITITREDYDNWTPSNQTLIKVTIHCASVKTLKQGSKTIDVESNIVSYDTLGREGGFVFNFAGDPPNPQGGFNPPAINIEGNPLNQGGFVFGGNPPAINIEGNPLNQGGFVFGGNPPNP